MAQKPQGPVDRVSLLFATNDGHFFSEWGPTIWAFFKIVHETKSLRPERSGEGDGVGFLALSEKSFIKVIRCLPLLQVTFRKRSGTTWHDCRGLTVTMRSLALNRLEVFVGNVACCCQFQPQDLSHTSPHPPKNKLNEFQISCNSGIKKIRSSIEKRKEDKYLPSPGILSKTFFPFQAVEWFTLSACSKGDVAVKMRFLHLSSKSKRWVILRYKAGLYQSVIGRDYASIL